MRPIDTPGAKIVYKLPGGTEDNDLPVEKLHDERGTPILKSTWAPTAEERIAIGNGANVYLMVWGAAQPPVAIGVVGVEPS